MTFNNYMCKAYPTHTAKETGGRCYNNGYLVQVGYQVDTRFLKVLEVCHDKVTEETYYTKHRFSPANSKYQTGKLCTLFWRGIVSIRRESS